MILKNSAILAFFSILSLLLGIFRDRLLAQVVGVGPMLDVYNAAFRIPDLVYGLLLAAVSAMTVVPFITKAAKENEEELAEKFNSLFFFFGFGLSGLSIIAALLLPVLTPFIVPGFDEFQRQYFITASAVLLIQPIFLGLSALVSSLAQVKHRFILYSVAPLFYTLVIIISIPLLYPRFGVIGIISGVVAGAMLNFLVQSYTLYEARMRLSLSMFHWHHVVSHMRVAIPRSLSTVVSRVREIIFASVATTLGVGALSVYLFAQRIIDAFIQVVVQSAATATLPLLAHKHANGEHQDYTRTLKTNLATIFLLAGGAAVIIAVFKNPLVHLLYGNVARADEIARMAMFFAYTLPLYALSYYFVTAFSASRDTLGLFFSNLIASGLGVTALLIASKSGQGMFSLVIGSWVITISYILLLAFFYSRKRELPR